MFKPGQSGNPAGRKKGSKNKQSERIRQLYADLLENNLATFQSTYDLLLKKDPRAAASFLLQMTPFILPRLGKTDITSDGKPFQVILPSGVTGVPGNQNPSDSDEEEIDLSNLDELE
jgi:hypothetical protein